MPIFKYAKVLLQTPGIGSVLICFAGLSLGAVLISEWGRSGTRTPVLPSQQVAQSGYLPIAPSGFSPEALNVSREKRSIPEHPRPAISLATSHRTIEQVTRPNRDEAQHLMNSRIHQSTPVEQQTGNTARKPVGPRLDRAIFQQPIASDQLEFLTDYAGRPANEILRERRVRQLMNMVVPYAPFHLGLDMPLPNAIETILSGSPLPVEIREGRYMMVSTQGERGGPRGFIWIDMQQGIALGGIFFHPTNGEPTPTLTLFSNQVKENSLEMSQLPLAFAQDLNQRAAIASVPSITTRYFITASSKKIVLAHDEDFCKHAKGIPASPKDVCERMNADAADIDIKAVHFLDQTHYASNATMRMIVDPTGVEGYVAP